MKRIILLILLLSTVLIFVYSNTQWKLRAKGISKEVNTNPIIKGTSVFVDIYDISNLFNIDYEVNLTRKYILFHKIPVITNSNQSSSIQTKQTTQLTQTQKTQTQTTQNKENSENIQIAQNPYNSNGILLNSIIYKKLESIKTIVISNPVNQVKKLDDNNYKTYTEDIDNLENTIKSAFSEKNFKTIVLAKDFKLNDFDIKYIIQYLQEKNIDGAIIPILKKYYYFEKDGNSLVPTVELQINYLLLNKNGEIVFFNVQNISRTIAVISSGSVKYRKSKLLDLSRMSVDFFIRDYNEYIEILSKSQ